MADHQFAELTGKVGVIGEEVKSFPEKLANVRINARDRAGNYFSQIRAVIGDDAIEIREGDDLFPRGGQTGRIPSFIESLRRDAAGNTDPSPAKMATVTFRIGEHRPD